MKVLILAARSRRYGRAQDEKSSWMLQHLGDHAIIDYVLQLACSVAETKDIVIVTTTEDDKIRQHLGSSLQFVTQTEAYGTGDAVLRARTALNGYDGPLLILYGDTPLLRASSVRGLVTRHRLKNADFTLLSAQATGKMAYGEIIRDEQGQIIAIREHSAIASTDSAKTEYNIGAYVTETTSLWPALEAVRHPDAAHRLTDVVAQLAESGLSVASYHALDPDELQGVNTADDLARAAFILQKRQLRPQRSEEHNEIHFGTGGWRARIGEGFTLDNVRRLCQALANNIVRLDKEDQGVLVGYDRRFLGDVAAHAAIEVFTGNNVAAHLLREDAPTPLVTYATAQYEFAYGLMFTASHNPALWNGLKVFASDGSLPLDDETRLIAAEANAIQPQDVVKVELETALESGLATFADYTNEYVDAVEALIDLAAIREAGLRVVLDPMYGVGQVTLETVLIEARCRVNTIHGRHDPLFGGRSPAPDASALGNLINTVIEGGYDLGLAMDGDADRIAIVDDTGNFVTTNELLLLLYYYLHEVRGESGGVTRNLATTHLLDRLATHFGETCYETPVGFKHLAASMKDHDVLLAGESSGGLSIRGHILGKDGIFACALVVEMIARTGRSISAMLDEIYTITGHLVSRELNLPATSEMRALVPRLLETADLNEIANLPVQSISHEDGVKFYLADDHWLLLRFSGTEALLRIFAEGANAAIVEALINWARQLITIE